MKFENNGLKITVKPTQNDLKLHKNLVQNLIAKKNQQCPSKFIAKVHEIVFIADAPSPKHTGTVHIRKNIGAMTSAHYRLKELNISGISLCRILRKDFSLTPRLCMPFY